MAHTAGALTLIDGARRLRTRRSISVSAPALCAIAIISRTGLIVPKALETCVTVRGLSSFRILLHEEFAALRFHGDYAQPCSFSSQSI